MFDLSGKVVIVTGGAGYLGRAMCEALAMHNATVVIASRNYDKNRELEENLRNRFNNENMAIQLDISSVKSIKESTAKIIEKYKKIDVIINNAHYSSGREITEMTEEQWIRGVDGTINGVYRCVNAVLPHMIENKKGTIINIASMYGVVSPDVSVYENNDYYNPANYGVGKAGIIQLTKYIASVYGSYGITSNCISPGPFPSDAVQENKDFIKSLEEKVPLNRIGKPDDLKGVIVLLASDASDYINGANIMVDGGWTAW